MRISDWSSDVCSSDLNWWFAHNVLGLWLTPIGVGAGYYFIPKIIGKPIYSYSLSLLGFWGLALFYSQVGIHHLIGGPVPTWVVTLSIVTRSEARRGGKECVSTCRSRCPPYH